MRRGEIFGLDRFSSLYLASRLRLGESSSGEARPYWDQGGGGGSSRHYERGVRPRDSKVDRIKRRNMRRAPRS